MSESKLTSIMDDDIYLARDYSSIIKWFIERLQYWTTSWTDLSISEPDTLTLSFIAYVYDLTNYLIDQKFLQTVLSYTESVRFLSYLHKLVGSELFDYRSAALSLIVDNQSHDEVIFSKFEILRLADHPSELVSVLDDYIIQPNSKAIIKAVRGTPTYMSKSISDTNNGCIYLPTGSRINRESVAVYANGEDSIEKVDDALFSYDKTYSVHQDGEYNTMVRVSPKVCRTCDMLLIAYCLNDPYPVAQDSKFVRLSDPDTDVEYTITSGEVVDTSDVTVNEMKLRYYSLLRKVSSLYNENYDVSDAIRDSKRIDYLDYKFVSSSVIRDGIVDYESGVLILNLVETGVPLDISYIVVNDSGTRDSRSLSITTVENYTEVDFNLDSELGEEIEPMSVYIRTGECIASDTVGDKKINIIKGSTTNLSVNYSTIDGNPITSILDNGTVDYVTTALNLTLKYISDQLTTITYTYSTEFDDDILVRKDYQLNELINYLLLEVPEGATLNPGSIKIVNGDDIIIDNGEGVLESIQTCKSVLLNYLDEVTLIDLEESQIILNRLTVKRINVSAIIHLHSLNSDTESVRQDIVGALEIAYRKGKYQTGETVKRLPMILLIESSNSNIDYAELTYPQFDTPVDSNQIPELGNVTLEFTRE